MIIHRNKESFPLFADSRKVDKAIADNVFLSVITSINFNKLEYSAQITLPLIRLLC